MSKETYTFDDLDDILAEFSGKKESQPEVFKAAEEIKKEKTASMELPLPPVEKPAPRREVHRLWHCMRIRLNGCESSRVHH